MSQPLSEDPRHYGERGNIYNPTADLVSILGRYDTARDISVAMHAVAGRIAELARDGWALDGPVVDGVARLYWIRTEAPPADVSAVVNGMQAHERIAVMVDRP